MITKDSKTDLAFTSPTSIELRCETRPLRVDTQDTCILLINKNYEEAAWQRA